MPFRQNLNERINENNFIRYGNVMQFDSKFIFFYFQNRDTNRNTNFNFKYNFVLSITEMIFGALCLFALASADGKYAVEQYQTFIERH